MPLTKLLYQERLRENIGAPTKKGRKTNTKYNNERTEDILLSTAVSFIFRSVDPVRLRSSAYRTPTSAQNRASQKYEPLGNPRWVQGIASFNRAHGSPILITQRQVGSGAPK